MANPQIKSSISVKRPGEKEILDLNVQSWPIWTKEPSTFDWYYDDQETCFILEGEATVKTESGEVSFGKGDLVTFPKGLSCKWIVKKAIRKHYRFG